MRITNFVHAPKVEEPVEEPKEDEKEEGEEIEEEQIEKIEKYYVREKEILGKRISWHRGKFARCETLTRLSSEFLI